MAKQLIYRRRILQGAMAGLLLTMLSACGPFVRSDYDSRTNLANYRTFSFEQRSEPRSRERAFDNPINEKRLREAVAARLSERGIQPTAEGAAADCIVSVAIGSRSYADNSYPRWSFGIGTGWGWGRRGYYGNSVLVEDDILYRENRVSIDLFDAKTREPIWHASTDTDVSGLTGENAQSRIDAAVNAMFAKFPKQ